LTGTPQSMIFNALNTGADDSEISKRQC